MLVASGANEGPKFKKEGDKKMKFVSKIAEKILSHCSKCGGCPVGKIMDAQAEIEGKGNPTAKKALKREAKNQSP